MYFSPKRSETSSLPRGAQRATEILKARLYSRAEFAFPERLMTDLGDVTNVQASI
jgi:hypothetical protein